MNRETCGISMHISRIILLFVVTIICNVRLEIVNEKTPRFEKDEAYRDIFPISKQNFTQKVLKSEDAWVILFHKGTLKRTWKTLAVSLRGVISFGSVDINEEPELIHKLAYDQETTHEARVYPYGSKSTKEKHFKEISSPNEVKSVATKSIPNYILDIRNMGIQDFLVDCLSSVPSRFPVIIFTESKEIQAMFKLLCLRLERYFNFGHMVNPSTSDLQELGIQDVYVDIPSVIVITTSSNNINDPEFNAIQYMKSTYGDMSYPNVLKFLININKKFRHLLAGDNKSQVREDIEMTEILRKESEKFEIIDNGEIHMHVHRDQDFIVENVIGSKLPDEL